MKYYLIAGEASGDLHASRLMHSLMKADGAAEFRFFGGDLMKAVGGTCVKHYRELAYMGVIPVLLHLRTILNNMRMCKRDIRQWQPDVVILVDYPGFNLDIAKCVHSQCLCPVYYYISPKIWAWKEYRIRRIKRDVDELFSILPFEVSFFEQKHHFPIHYVGNPTAEEVREFLSEEPLSAEPLSEESLSVECRVESVEFATALPANNQPTSAVANSKLSTLNSKLKNSPLSTLHSSLPVIALLAGSRKQEIKDNLPAMLQVADDYADRYQIVVAGAPSIDRDFYTPLLAGHKATVVHDQTYSLLHRATAALVTSGTATLETALFGVPQVVCYRLPMAKVYGALRKLLLKVKYVSLVNLVAEREVVPELVAETFSVEALRRCLADILPGGDGREAMLRGYDEVRRRLGDKCAPDEAARLMVKLLNKK